MDDDMMASMAEWRRYQARRRRFLRRNPLLNERFERLKELRKSVDKEYTAACRVFQQRRKEVWRTDPEVRRHRDAYARLRRRERRLDAQLEEELALHLGPEPP